MGQPGESERVVAGEEHVGRTCPYCRFPLKQGGEVVLCGFCRSAHHADCWSDNAGCAIVGCAGGPEAQTRTDDPTVVMPAPWGQAPALTGSGFQPGPPPPPGAPPPWPAPAGRSYWQRNKELVAALGALVLALGAVGIAVIVTSGNSNAAPSSPYAQQPSANPGPTGYSNTGPTGSSNTGPTGYSNTGPTGNTAATSSGVTPNTYHPPRGPDAGAGGALRTYWRDANEGDYVAAVGLETPQEAINRSVASFTTDSPHINVLSIGRPAPDGSGKAIVRINFYAKNTTGSDLACRHFIIDSLMVSSGGRWLYAGPSPTLTDQTSNSTHCPA
jgi:Prokaryotic RING finger family 1